MNKEILKLRSNGYGYKRIAKELGITISAARHACLKSEDDTNLGKCKNCEIEIKSIKGKKKKIFCSDKCRMSWWNKNQNKVNKKAYYTHQCKVCNKKFDVYGNSKRIYCSQECYLKGKAQKGGDSNEAI